MAVGNLINEEKVYINDVTLREGDQAPLTSFIAEEKKIIALMLKEVGVHSIEAGFASSRADFDNIRGVVEMFMDDEDAPVVTTLGRAVDSDTEASLKVLEGYRNGRVHIVMATSDEHIQEKFPNKGNTQEERRQWVMDAIVRNLQIVKKYKDEVNPNLEIEFSPEDATGNALTKREDGRRYLDFQSEDFNYLIEVIRAAIKAGATIINTPDTLGNFLPHESEAFFRELIIRTDDLRDQYTFDFSTHIHNDMASASNGAIAGVRGGARQIEVTTAGIGERTGNTSLHEVVGIINNRGHAITDGEEIIVPSQEIQTELIGPITRFVERILTLNKSLQTPFIGALSDVDGSGIHTAAEKVYGGTKNKRDFGGEDMEVFFSPRSGANQICEILSSRFSVNADKSSEVIQRVTARACREAETVKALYPARIYAIYLQEARGLEISDIAINGNHVSITISVGGKTISLEGTGGGENGIIDATIQAINSYLGEEVIDVVDLEVKNKPSLKALYEKFVTEVSNTSVVLTEKFSSRAMDIVGKNGEEHGSEQIGVVHMVLNVDGEELNIRSVGQNTDDATVKGIVNASLSKIVTR